MKRDSKLDTSLYDALLPAAEGDIDQTLRLLRRLSSPEARGAIFRHLIQRDGKEKALDWVKTTGIEILDLDPPGALNLLLQRIENGEYENALKDAETLTDAQFAALPALRLVKSGLLLASLLPKDQKSVPFQGLPITPRVLQFNSLETTPAKLGRARTELEATLPIVCSLALTKVAQLLEEQILWLRLEDQTTRESAKREITDEINDAKHTLRRVRLALAYDVPFNRDALKRKLEADRRVGKWTILAFSGSRPLFDLSGVRRLALDITTLLTLEFLGLLQKTIDAFDQVIISPSTLSSLFADRQFIRFQQPSEVTKAKAIKKLLGNGKLSVLRALRTDAEVAALDIDPDLQTLLDAAKAKKGVVVRSAPVYKLRSFMEEEVDLSSYENVLSDTRAVLSLVRNKITAQMEASASAYLSQVDKGWPKQANLTKSSIVYIDQLAVTYLHHVGILEAFVDSVANVYVAQDLETHADAVLRGDDFAADLVNAVERIRSTLSTALEKGTVTFSARRRPQSDGEGSVEDELNVEFPTMDLLSDLSEADAIAVDDRFLNKEGFWTDGKHRIPCISTLEIIIALNGRGVISESQKYGVLHELREGGYCTVTTDTAELLRELNRSTVEDGRLVESRELSAIRTNTTIALRSRMHSALETPWVDYTRATIMQALRQLWTDSAPAASIIPRADWLLASLPSPIRLLQAPSDDEQWDSASQKAASFMGLMLAPPFAPRERLREYSNWVEGRLGASLRVNHPALFRRSINSLSDFLAKLVQIKDDVPVKLRRAIVAELMSNLPSEVESRVLDTSQLGPAVGLKTTPVLTLNNTHAIILDSLVETLRLGLARKSTATLAMADGTNADVRLKYAAPGTVTIQFPDAAFPIAESDLLIGTKSGRKRALTRLFSQRPLSGDEEKGWFAKAASSSFSAEDFADLLRQLRITPEHMKGYLGAPQTLNADKLAPKESSYYVRLVGPVPKCLSFGDYIEHEQQAHRFFLLSRGRVGLRRLAYSAISRSTICFEELANLPLAEIERLISCEDPFSLLFGLELCQDRVKRGEKAALALGTRFLKRLLGDADWLQRVLEIYSACAVIASVSFRPEVNDPAPPLYWYRLAILTHAGVLTDALRGIKKAPDFLKWAASEYGSSYLWHNVVDAREEPRWECDWISPQALKAEILGRCHNVLVQLPPKKRPKTWEKLIIPALKELNTPLEAFFPGPLDGFFSFASPMQAEQEIEQMRSLLKRQSSFKRAPGLIILAYAGAIDDRLTDEIFRLLNASDEQLAKTRTADQILRCCAYIASTTGNGELAKAVGTRCLRLLSSQLSPDINLRLLLISMRACGAYRDPANYYREIAALAARFAYAMPTNNLFEMRKVLEVMKTRDPRLGAAFGRAEAVLEATMLAV